MQQMPEPAVGILLTEKENNMDGMRFNCKTK
jgi:hypothetical protein